MSIERIGTIIHGALGDCYEQMLSIRMLRERERREGRRTLWTAFFADPRDLRIMSHFQSEMFDAIYPASELVSVDVDRFHQYQVKDVELRADILDPLPDRIRNKFDLERVVKPWHQIRTHDFDRSGLALGLSDAGQAFLPECIRLNGVDTGLFGRTLTVGYLWRHRGATEAHITPLRQKNAEWIVATKTDLFRRLIAEYGAHVFVAGMKKTEHPPEMLELMHRQGFQGGSYKAKYTDLTFDLPPDRVTYLKGLGFAEEMDIMARCDVLLMMPSGFSEALWMMKRNPVILIDPPPVYMARLFWNRMPLFDNGKLDHAVFNALRSHTADTVIGFLKRKGHLPQRPRARGTGGP